MAPLYTITMIVTVMSLAMSPTTSLSLKKVIGMIEKAEQELKQELDADLSDTLKKAETRMGEEFGIKMRNITKEILTDVLTGPKEWLENVNEVRSCLTHTCKNGGTCHQTADVCLCAVGFSGSHCEKCVTGFKGTQENTCIPDEKIYLSLKPHGSSNYVLGTTASSWQAARAACQKIAKGGDLAAAETEAEWSHIYEDIKRVDGGDYHWIGASGQGTSGHWTWVSGGAITSSPKGVGNWYSNQPLDSGSACLLSLIPNSTAKTDNWDDKTCSSTRKFICEY